MDAKIQSLQATVQYVTKSLDFTQKEVDDLKQEDLNQVSTLESGTSATAPTPRGGGIAVGDVTRVETAGVWRSSVRKDLMTVSSPGAAGNAGSRVADAVPTTSRTGESTPHASTPQSSSRASSRTCKKT
ncbi:hypothetical protein E2C01_091093 [Portunus trituberculatus]|uniref:Uncharacterized protein n=1 Tax=Portunus trituberculatus TaxID=210409 RepID=A0A5B7JU54_PORTR|nr:hypothetical protein [Portunus trituberculatus]